MPELSGGETAPHSECSSWADRTIFQLDVEGLNITVTSRPVDNGSAKGRGKAKASEGTEILSNAKLRLKAGGRYALVGRNGTGKSSKSF
jgi:ATPase components of ABC transporters with duplicated ATPase domains